MLEKGASPHHESLFSDDVVMVSYYCGVVRQRVYLTPEKAALKAGHSQVAHFIREFDLEMNRAKKRGLNVSREFTMINRCVKTIFEF